jgi:egghead protein (zeste-white 4 protein)
LLKKVVRQVGGNLFKLVFKILFWGFMILLVSILIPALLMENGLFYLRPWALYINSVFEGVYGLVRSASLASLIMLVDLPLFSMAAIMVMLNNRGGDNYLKETRLEGENHGGNVPVFLQYTAQNYNQSIEKVFGAKRAHLIDMLGFSFLMGSMIPGAPIVASPLDMSIHMMKYSWLIGTPHLMLQNIGYLSFKKDDFLLDEGALSRNIDCLNGKHVIFILPTRGRNFSTIKTSAESVIFWKEVFELNYGKVVRISQWIVCEQDDYEANAEEYEEFASMGSRIIIVPRDFSTPNGTRYKARALTYAHKVLFEEGLANRDTWIYHQDDETKVGEDTILGIMDYIANAAGNDIYAAGIINYSDSLAYTPSRAQEPSRSYDDFRILFTTKTNGRLSFGHHGSHLLVRADTEIGIGWDFGDVRTEDWMFGLMMWQKHKPGNTILKGFCYEKPPLSARDLLKQRRRWAYGAMQIIRDKRVKLRFRLAALYGMVSWFSGLPSIIAFILTLIHPTGGLFPGSGFIAGFTWYSLYRYYSAGYSINEIYIASQEKNSGLAGKFRKITAIIGGMMLEALAPWYALIRPPRGFEVIKKDDAREAVNSERQRVEIVAS